MNIPSEIRVIDLNCTMHEHKNYSDILWSMS
jgi:hypothetical protein